MFGILWQLSASPADPRDRQLVERALGVLDRSDAPGAASPQSNNLDETVQERQCGSVVARDTQPRCERAFRWALWDAVPRNRES